MLKQALSQIEERGYAKRFEGTGLQVFKVALAVTGRSDVAIRVVRGSND
jgi:DNA-binding IclR family transcriptional regulator